LGIHMVANQANRTDHTAIAASLHAPYIKTLLTLNLT
jgi:hypothetical protein